MKKRNYTKRHIEHPPESDERQGSDFAWFELEHLFMRWLVDRKKRMEASEGQA